MTISEQIPDIANFYAVTEDGQLGSYDAERQFVPDPALSRTFAQLIQGLLKTYRQNPDAGGYRLAVIYPSDALKPWKSATLAFETAILQRLYPTGGGQDGHLTIFQMKNREKSIFQGMELVLDYNDDSVPDVPVYLPVLFYRNTMLADYPILSEGSVHGLGKKIPVIEVLNFVAPIPIARRTHAALKAFKKAVYDRIVKKDKRDEFAYALIEDAKDKPFGWAAEDVEPAEAYADVDKRAEREALQLFLEKARGGSYTDCLQLHCSEETSALMAQCLLRPYQFLAPEALRTFKKFRGLDMESLMLLAKKNPVFEAPLGACLLAQGTDDKWNLYLLDGVITLRAADGAEKLIEGGTDSACMPVSSLKPRMYTVIAATPVRFMWIYDPLVEAVTALNAGRNKFELGLY